MIQLKAPLWFTVGLLISCSELSESQLMIWAVKTTQGGTRRLWPHPAIIKSSSLSARSVQTLLFPWHIITFHKSFSYPTSCNASKPTNPPPVLSMQGLGRWGGGYWQYKFLLLFTFACLLIPFIVFLSILWLFFYSSWRQGMTCWFCTALRLLSDQRQNRRVI